MREGFRAAPPGDEPITLHQVNAMEIGWDNKAPEVQDRCFSWNHDGILLITYILLESEMVVVFCLVC